MTSKITLLVGITLFIKRFMLRELPCGTVARIDLWGTICFCLIFGEQHEKRYFIGLYFG